MTKNKLLNGCIATSPAGFAFKEAFEAGVETVRGQMETWMEQGRLPSNEEFVHAEARYYDLCDSLRVTSYSRRLDKSELALATFCHKIAEEFKRIGVAPLPPIERLKGQES
jgi:hypothetical protein